MGCLASVCVPNYGYLRVFILNRYFINTYFIDYLIYVDIILTKYLIGMSIAPFEI
jgi:hypothetical protein